MPQTTTSPAGTPSGCDSDAVIELPPSLRLVPGPDAVTFCGFLDADVMEIEDHELISEPPPPMAAQRHDKILPPPLVTEDDLDDEIIYPSSER